MKHLLFILCLKSEADRLGVKLNAEETEQAISFFNQYRKTMGEPEAFGKCLLVIERLADRIKHTE